jgi:hypothetical protein
MKIVEHICTICDKVDSLRQLKHVADASMQAMLAYTTNSSSSSKKTTNSVNGDEDEENVNDDDDDDDVVLYTKCCSFSSPLSLLLLLLLLLLLYAYQCISKFGYIFIRLFSLHFWATKYI